MSTDSKDIQRDQIYIEAQAKFIQGMTVLEAIASIGAAYPHVEAKLVEEVVHDAYDKCVETKTAWGGKLGPPCEDLERDKNGWIKATTSNLLRLFQTDKRLIGCLKWNEFTGAIEVGSARPPWFDCTVAEGTPMTDILLTTGMVWFAMKEKIGYPVHEFSSDMFFKGCSAYAHAQRYHPLQDFLRLCRWDGEPRLDLFLTTAAGCKADDYHLAISKIIFLGLVQRAFEPGCSFDVIPVLSGKQGIGKSRLWAAVGGEYFADTHLDLNAGKDAYAALRNIWLFELSELSSTRRADNERVKAFVSSRYDTYRPPYGRVTEHQPRTTIFAGSTNADDFLSDDSGARRWLPVRCEHPINVQWAHDNREQLFGEAFARYVHGERWLTAYESIKPEQATRTDAFEFQDNRIDMILRWAAQPDSPAAFELVDMMSACFPKEKFSRTEQKVYGALLRKAGFERRRTRVGKDTPWLWSKKEDRDAEPPEALPVPALYSEPAPDAST